MTIEAKHAPFEFKFLDGSGDPAGTFEGYCACFGNIDDGEDKLLPGAFVNTLAQAKALGRMPKMLLNHGGMAGFGLNRPAPADLLPIGKWMAMGEDSRGLESKGRLINLDTESGKRIYGAMRENELDSLSIGYKATKFVRGTRAGEPKRTISAVDLFEASLVTFPMNRLALVTNVKAAQQVETIREFESFLRDAGGYSHAAAKAIAAGGFKASQPDPRDEDGMISQIVAGEFARLAAFIRS
jgi:HK97 family phage prohead protease